MLSLRAKGMRLILKRQKPSEERSLEEDRENFKKISGLEGFKSARAQL